VFVGHYSAALAAKALGPRIPLAALFLAVQLVDVAWTLLVLLGVERVRIVPGLTASSPLDLVYMPFTHSLPAALLWGAAAGLAWRRIVGGDARAAWLVAAAVGSHWLLDFLVHRPDLPLWGDSAKVGLGLWDHRSLALALELGLVAAAAALLWRRVPAARAYVPWLCAGLTVLQLASLFGPVPGSPQAFVATALALFLGVAAAAHWLEVRAPRWPS
jgi:hypothetical protein